MTIDPSEILSTYRDFRPTAFDIAGLHADSLDIGDWYVSPCTVNRDSSCLDRANWKAVIESLESANLEEFEDYQIIRFGHWANGWFEILIVHPARPGADIVAEIAAALAEYPIVSDGIFSDLEYGETVAEWGSLSMRERIGLCSEAGCSIFAARRDSPPERVFERMTRGW